MTNETAPQPYDRREGEPNRWYQRFVYYMELGPHRSLARCYREMANAVRTREGRPLLTTAASCPSVWRQRARQFDWLERAEAWDRQQRRLELEQVEHVRTLARELAEEAIQVLEQTMRGELKNPDGTLTEGQNCTQRRLAAEKILDLAGVASLEPEEFEAEDEDSIRVREIRIIDPYSPEGLEHHRRVREQADARYAERNNGGHQPANKRESLNSDE